MGTPCGARTGIVRAPHGNLQCFSYPMGPVRDPQECRTTALRTRTGIDTTRIGKTPARASYLAVRAPQGLFTGCLQSINPYGARKLIMHALKLYRPRTGRQNSYGAARGPCGPRGWTYDFCSKQAGNSPYVARECDVTEALAIVAKDGLFWFSIVTSLQLIYDVTRMRASGIVTSYLSIVLARANWRKGDLH